jgi:hypothetical protein
MLRSWESSVESLVLMSPSQLARLCWQQQQHGTSKIKCLFWWVRAGGKMCSIGHHLDLVPSPICFLPLDWICRRIAAYTINNLCFSCHPGLLLATSLSLLPDSSRQAGQRSLCPVFLCCQLETHTLPIEKCRLYHSDRWVSTNITFILVIFTENVQLQH